MESVPKWTQEVEDSLAAVVAAVLAAGRNAAAQPLWRFLQRGGRLPAGRLPRHALAGSLVHEVMASEEEDARGPAPGFAGAPPLQSASGVGHHVAALSAVGEVLCSEHPREGLAPVRLPWPAAAVSCGGGSNDSGDDDCYAYARQRGGGAVCRWRLGADRYSDGVPAVPEAVRGLPPRDPVAMLEGGVGLTVALTASGAAFGWGHDLLLRRFGAADGAAVRIPQLSGRRIRRLACGLFAAAAETEEGDLLSFGLNAHDPLQGPPILLRLPAEETAPSVAFPLRDMVAVGDGVMVILDSVGTVWIVNISHLPTGFIGFAELPLPPAARGQRVVRVAASGEDGGATGSCIVALTDSGELWSSCRRRAVEQLHAARNNAPCWQSISAARPELPLGLLPGGGALAERVVLLPDLSCGRARLKVFARIAARLGVPGDVVRTALLRAAVQSCYVVGPEHDPFGWPAAPAPAAEAAAAAAAER